MATINKLPNELLIKIFEYLKIRDIVYCSLVCKRFKLLCQDVTIPELIVCNTTVNIKYFWFYTKRQFNLQDSIDVATFNSYRSIFRLDKFRRLYFAGCQSEYAQLKINDLTHLEQVKIKVNEDVTGFQAEIYINMSHLKIIEIDTAYHTFLITAPKAEMLKCCDFDFIDLTYPNTIKHLETDKYRRSFHVLKNLQFLLVPLLIDIAIDIAWSNVFPSLKTLSCCSTVGFCPTEIKKLVEYKRIHQRSVPKIYFLSVEVDNIKRLDDSWYYDDEFLFQMNNYNSLAETVATSGIGIHYSQLMDSMNEKIPEDFYKKYFSIQRIYVTNKVKDQEQLFQFVTKFDYLIELTLTGDSLDQFYFNRLAELDQLARLIVIKNSTSPISDMLHSKTTLNFDFLMKMNRLHFFWAGLDSPHFFDLTLKLFKQLKYFKTAGFYFAGQHVRIQKHIASNDYTFSYCGSEKSQLDFDGLVCEVEAVRNRRSHYYDQYPHVSDDTCVVA